MNDFEHLLKHQPLRGLPPEWRAEILNAARRREPVEKPAQTPWWLAWLWSSPVAWACVACAWVVIIGLNVASRPTAVETVALTSRSPQEIEMALIQQRQLVQELFRTETEPAEPPRRREIPGACNGRATQIQTATV
jgi:hypothetical protein